MLETGGADGAAGPVALLSWTSSSGTSPLYACRSGGGGREGREGVEEEGGGREGGNRVRAKWSSEMKEGGGVSGHKKC